MKKPKFDRKLSLQIDAAHKALALAKAQRNWLRAAALLARLRLLEKRIPL